MLDFFKNIVATLVALAIISVVIYVLALSTLSEPPPAVPEGAMLVIDLSRPITDKPAMGNASDIVYGAPLETLTLHALNEAIRRAGDDGRIEGILLHGTISASGLDSGWASLREVRGALDAFRKKGKKVYAYNMTFGERDYYLASAADAVYINPAGLLEFNGFAAERLFYAAAFEKYGIDVQITRVGKYKSAVEPYTLEKMSAPSREQLENFLGDMFDEFLEAVSAAREIPVEALRHLTGAGVLLSGEDAVNAGLADRVLYFDEVIDELKGATGRTEKEDTFKQVSVAEYIEAIDPEADPAQGEKRIAVIFAEGEIVDGADPVDAGGDTIARLLRRARLDDDVAAVVLRVNSPGGSASAAEVILREVILTGEAKPIVVSMGSLAASGGYWIACAADEIVAEPNTITGSIGVFGMFPNVRGLLGKIGISVDVVATAPHADMISPFRPKTERELEIFQDLVNRTYDDFLERVSQGRDLDRDTVHVIAQGRVWSGKDAVELGLVDRLGGLDDAVECAARRAGLTPGHAIQYYQKERVLLEDLADLFLRDDEKLARAFLGTRFTGDAPLFPGGAHRPGQIERGLSRFIDDLRMFDRLNDPRGIYARMPWNIIIR